MMKNVKHLQGATLIAILVALTSVIPQAAGVPGSGTLYGTDSIGGNLLTVDTATGVGTVVGPMEAGAVPALAVDPTAGIIYAGRGGGAPYLYTVDPSTGAATLVGDTGLGFAAIGGMDFDASGTLYAAVNIAGDGGTGSDHLAVIDKTTGAATVIGSFGTCTGVQIPSTGGGSCDNEGIEGIAFDQSGVLWGSHSARGSAGAPGLYAINPATGTATFSRPILDASGNHPSGGVVSLQFDSNSTLFGGTARAVSPATDGGFLITIDPSTGLFSFVGALSATGGESLGGMAFGPPRPPSRWSIKAPMPEPREGAAGAVIDDKIYVIAGFSPFFGDTGMNRRYDPVTDIWSAPLASAPFSTSEFYQSAAVAGKMYVIGGRGPAFGQVQIYDPVTDSWTIGVPMNTPRVGMAVAEVGAVIYTFGGRDCSVPLCGGPFNTVEAYDPVTNTWTPKTPMPTARMDLAAAVVAGLIYVIGGFDPLRGVLSTVERYDPATDTWTTGLAPLPTPRATLGAAVCPPDRVYAIGGVTGFAAQVSTNEQYDPATNTWTTADPMPTARGELVAVTVGDLIFAIGGGFFGASVADNEAFECRAPPIQRVEIDIKPGSDPNSINVKSTGIVSVAVLATATFDAATVDPSTVRFGRTGTEATPVHSALEDVDGDGDLDAIFHFATQNAGIQAGDTQATLTGSTFDGTAITGIDSIRAFHPGDTNGDLIVNIADRYESRLA